jgi:hypothetical protein
MGDNNNTVVVNQTTSIISAGAFAQLFTQAMSSISSNSLVDIEVNIGAGNIVIESGAFQQALTLPNGFRINSATFTFDPLCVPDLGSNFASNLPVRNLSLPAQTTLQANALLNLPALLHLDASQLVNPVPANGLNLSRQTAAPLIVSMPTNPSVTYATGAVVLPISATGSATTLVFDGTLPSASQLSEMFALQAQAVGGAAAAPIQISLNYANTSNVTNEQLLALQSSLNNPVTVPFNQVQNVIQGVAEATTIAAGGQLTDVNQFAGEMFDSIIIAPKAAAKALKQSVITTLNELAVKSNVKNIPIPVSINQSGNANDDHNVIGLVPRMKISVTSLASTWYYVMDNYIDPSDTTLPSVPLMAIFSKENAGTTVGTFFPAVVCNGSLSISTGSIVISGKRTGDNAYCHGYNAVGSATQASINLLTLTIGTNEVVSIYDKSTNSTALPIAKLTFPDADTFSLQFNAIASFESSDKNSENIVGCMQGYKPIGAGDIKMVTDFTNVANKSNIVWNTFATEVAKVIASNNLLVNLSDRIRAQVIPNGLTVTHAIPANVSISNELTALSKSDFNMALSNWKALHIKFVNSYDTYLTELNAYVVAAQAVTVNNATYVTTNTAFNGFKTELDVPLASVRTALTEVAVANVAGVNAPLYANAISNYINARLSIGVRAFKACTLLDRTPNFEFLRNINAINDETFYFCNALKTPINIPVNVISIGQSAYYQCIDAPSIDIQNAFALRTIGESAFEGCSKAGGNLAFSSAIGQLSSVERIGNRAFRDCVALTDHIYFPPGLLSLGVSAFENCTSLNGTIVFPQNANFTIIPDRAFASCGALTGISTNTGNGTSLIYVTGYGENTGKPIPNGLVIPSNVAQIGNSAFLQCSKFAGALNLQQSQQSAIASIGDSAFNGCSSFTSLILPTVSTYTTVSSECFKNCSNITNLVLPPNVVHILDSSFLNCNKIANVPKLENVTSIGNEAFRGCSAMVGPLVLGTSLSVLGDRAFYDCTFLTSATFLGPPPLGLNQATLIFGIVAQAGANTPFYVNVFTENGWKGGNLIDANDTINIHKGFRALVTGSKSVVQMSYIDFNTYVPPPPSREITINNYQAFNVYANQDDTVNVVVAAPATGHSWNDVCIPSTLIGPTLASATSNINQAPLLQNLISTLVTPKVDAVQAGAINAKFSSNSVMNSIDGRNFEIKVSNPGVAHALFNIASIPSTGTAGYGVHTVAGVDKLYYAANDTEEAVLNNKPISLYVNSTGALLPKYDNKIINVGSDGVISIANISVIGYGAINDPTAVLFTTDQPTTDRTGKGYTILKAAGVHDKLYINTLTASAGAYYIANVIAFGGTTNPVQAGEVTKYNGKVVNVMQDGSIHVLVDQLNSHFIDIQVANSAVNPAGMVVGSYALIVSTPAKSGANTNYQLFHRPSADPAAVAASHYYHIHSSNIVDFNNRMILVLPNGGVSVGSFGMTGCIQRLEERVTALVAQSIPIYSTNAEFQNFDYHVNGVFSSAEQKLLDSVFDLSMKVDTQIQNHALLKSQLGTEFSAIQTAIIGQTSQTGINFKTAFAQLDTSAVALQTAWANYQPAQEEFAVSLDNLNQLTFGGNNVVGLKQIQSNTLTNDNGINQFRRTSTFNPNALSSSIPENQLVNDQAYITAQVNTFLTEMLFTQYGNRFNDIDRLINSVKTTVLFTVSPTTDVPAKNLFYNNLSMQQKMLFDYVANAVNMWFNSSTVEAVGVAGGQTSWGVVPTSTNPGTKLYSVTAGTTVDATKASLLAWGSANIVAYFTNGAATFYTQFNTNNQPASLDNIRSSLQAYETNRNLVANNDPVTSNTVANRAYIVASVVKTTQLNVSIDATAQTTLTTAEKGKLRFNNATQTSSTQLYISFEDGQATPASINLVGYFDEIRLSNGVAYTVKHVTKTANCYILEVAHVAGTTAANADAVVSFDRYQTVSIHTLGKMALMNNYVYAQYYNTVNGAAGIKAALIQSKDILKTKMSNLLTALNIVDGKINEVVQKTNDLNRLEDLLTATLHSTSASGTSLELNGANMLAREMELFKIALANTVNPGTATTPALATRGTYESEWFKTRVAAFWVAQKEGETDGTKLPTPSNRLNAYPAINAAFDLARDVMQNAAIDSYIANALPSQNMSIPIGTSVICDQAQKIAQSIPVHLKATFSKEALAKKIAEKTSLYVFGRQIATAGLNGDAAIVARNKFQMDKIKEAADAMILAKIAYGNASYNRYIAIIDFAISKGYYAGLPGQTALLAGKTNTFQTAMQQWNVVSSSKKNEVFNTVIEPLLFNMVYTNDATATYDPATFPLKMQNDEAVSWFGSAQNGFLNKIIANGLEFANNTLNYTALPFTAYELLAPDIVTYNGASITLTEANKITLTVNATPTTYELITQSNAVTSPAALTSIQYSGLLQTSVEGTTIPNPFNVASARTAVTAVSSTQYTIVSIGYSSLPISTSQTLSTLGFTEVTNTMQFTVGANNGTPLYQFNANNQWFFGYQQSSNFTNSWSKLSATQDAVIFYPGTQGQPPVNLENNINALCDNAQYVMIIEPIVSSTVKAISLYTYDAFGIDSGTLVAIGTLTPTAANPILSLYSVKGALQQIGGSSTDVNLVGDLVIPSRVKTIGVRAFSGSKKIKTLTFNVEQTSSVDIGSNAFEQCDLLPALNMGSSIKSIGPSAFLKCMGATSLVLPPQISPFSVVNHWAFLGCKNIANNLPLNGNIVQINVQAFANCTKLKCSNLNENLPSSLQKIGLGAFMRCIGLTGSLNFNNLNQNGKLVSSIRLLGSAAFMGCHNLNGDLVLPDNSDYVRVLPYTFASMDAPMFNPSQQQLAAPPTDPAILPMKLTGNIDFTLNKVTSIERNAFYNCTQIETIKLSNIITSVGSQSFMNCSGIKGNLSIPASVKLIGSEAFKGCIGLTGLNIVSTTVSQVANDSLLALGDRCFQNCTSIVNSNSASGMIIPSSVGTIGDNVFQGCTSIVSVNVGSGLTKANSFGNGVFSDCTALERVTLAFSFLSRDVAGQSVVKNANAVAPLNNSFSGCFSLGVPSDIPAGTIQIQSGAIGWTPGRSPFFNRLTIVINNRNITFYLKEFDQLAKINVVDPSTEPLQQEAIPATDAQATVYIKASDMRKVFLTSTDSFVGNVGVGQEATDNGQLFFVRPEFFPKYLNVSNAQVVQGGIESYNAAIYEQLVKDDVMRYYAMSLFNSADWVTLFANDTEIVENMVASSGLMPIVPDGNTEDDGRNGYNTGVLNNIMRELNKVAYNVGTNQFLVRTDNYPLIGTKWLSLPDTVLPEQGNIGKKLFSMINRNDPNRISSMVLNGSTPSELPFLPGDQFIFIFTLNENKVTLTPGLPPVTVKKRTYLIKMILTDDFNTGNSTFVEHFNALYKPSPINQNITPVSGAYAADYMYSNYNLYLAIKPSVTNQTDNSVYSRVTQNTFEPIVTPVDSLPFTGWYYSYSQATQAIKLNFTPPDISTNPIKYSDLKYLSAYVYFPNNWNSVTVLPSINNFPQWVLKFNNGAASTYVIRYKAGFLNTAAETVNFLGQTVPFDYTNTHIQLLCPFTLPQEFITTLTGTSAPDANGVVQPGSLNLINGTNIYRQRETRYDIVNGLRRTNSTIGPFTYPPIARGYQCIPMGTSSPTGLQGLNLSQFTIDNVNGVQYATQFNPNKTVLDLLAELSPPGAGVSTFNLESVSLEINMSNNDGFVPNIIVKSVEVVAKNYESYYLAPLDPN